MLIEPTTISNLQEAVRYCEFAVPVGAGTKPALSAVPGVYDRISTLHLRGVVDYDPSEFTIAVLAGTPLKEVQQTLAEQGQYLPFDPPLADQGATIGGTVAAGMSGPGAFRYGPLRDFLIGVRFVDGEGRLLTGGGKVVKNAAGFDVPKFLIDSCGRLGVLAELTFKVFPKPEATMTIGIKPRGIDHARDLISKLSVEPFDLDAIDYEPTAGMIWARLAGNRAALDNRVQFFEKRLHLEKPLKISEPAEADYFWRRQLGFDWADGVLAKVPITPRQIKTLVNRRYLKCAISMAGNLAWVCGNVDAIMAIPTNLGRPLQILRPAVKLPGFSEGVSGFSHGGKIHVAIKEAFDPTGKFPPLFHPRSSQLQSDGPIHRDPSSN